MQEEDAKLFLVQIVEGFLELFNKGIVHRDLKPANILLKNGKIKIADFGFSKLIKNYNEVLVSCLGTPAYTAPQVLKSENYSSKCDIWSLGVMLYFMVCGKLPWKADSQYELIKMIES